MVYVVKETFNVSVQNIVGVTFLYHYIQFLYRHVAVPIRSESHHLIIEMRLKYCFYYPFQGFLYQLVFIAVYA